MIVSPEFLRYCGFRRLEVRQRPKQLPRAAGLPPRCAQRRTARELFAKRDELLADQDAEETDESNDGRCWRSDAQPAVDHPNQHAGAELQQIGLHRCAAGPASEACSPSAHFEKRTWMP